MPKNSLLWKIEGAHLPAASYLFGTMHVRDSRAFGNAGPAQKALKECEAFAAEFNLSEAGEGFDASVMQLPEGMTLELLISPRKYQKLRKILLKASRIDIEHFKYSLPFLLINILSEKALTSNKPYSLDEHLWHFAENEGKEMLGIETFAEQLEILSKIPLDLQVKMLLDMGKNISRYRKHLLHLTSLYEQGDIHRLFKVVKISSKGLRKLLLYRRNEIMAERIAGFASQKSLFAAIGAGHLAGGKGVIKLLKDKGLMVRPVKLPRESANN